MVLAPLQQSFESTSYTEVRQILGVATYLSAGGRREGSPVRLPKEENARSRHQRLFVENVRKTEGNRS